MELVSEFIGFATHDGTVHDAGTFILLGGPILIALLALNAVYNGIIATVNGLRRTVRLGAKARRHLVARGGVAALRPAATIAPAESATNVPVAYVRPRERSVAKVG